MHATRLEIACYSDFIACQLYPCRPLVQPFPLIHYPTLCPSHSSFTTNPTLHPTVHPPPLTHLTALSKICICSPSSSHFFSFSSVQWILLQYWDCTQRAKRRSWLILMPQSVCVATSSGQTLLRRTGTPNGMSNSTSHLRCVPYTSAHCMCSHAVIGTCDMCTVYCSCSQFPVLCDRVKLQLLDE